MPDATSMERLVERSKRAHKRGVSQTLFDMKLRAMRRDRACRMGPDLFLHNRAFEDCLERIALIRRRFRSALLVGCLDPGWRDRLADVADRVEVVDPGPLAAAAASGDYIIEDQWRPPSEAFDLCVAIGTLDTVNDLPRALQMLRKALTTDAFILGAIAGGETLPTLRACMFAADRVMGAASPHVHPRLDAPTLAQLLAAASFQMPVVDVDRVQLSYRAFGRLVGDLRAMGATNILQTRSPRPLNRAATAAAQNAFAAAGDGQRTLEQVEVLHFAAWTPSDQGLGRVNPSAA